jgi:RNA polymerase sigma-70 factor (TIGR02960 family)
VESGPHTELIRRARDGDGDAFGRLVDPYRGELHVHCYRILGSTQDAEDALQEALLAAWQGLRTFEERASIRTWLYRVTTNRCLNLLRSARRRPSARPAPDVDPPEPTRMGEAVWLQPYPDALLAGLGDTAPGPAARYEAREVLSLAFVTALQLLPPRQRAVLILRDVLGFRAKEVATILDCTQEAVTSALKRARAALRPRPPQPPPPPPGSRAEQQVVARLVAAFESGDVPGIVALLTDDAWVSMPPLPLQYQGRDLAAAFFRTVAFRAGRSYRLVATAANGQPAFGVYLRDPRARVAHANGLLVVTLAGERVSAITRFDTSVLPAFGLPRLLPD